MLNDRRRAILSALVEEYIHSAQPVASKSLVDRYQLRVSSATVRNDLAVLEETGYVFQPHVSSGRVPTDCGYRAFVDDIPVRDIAGLTPEEAEAIGGYYHALEREIDEIMRETSALLSRLTSYVAVVLAPTLTRARIRKIDVVRMGERRALVVVITDGGQVVNRTVEFSANVPEEAVRAVEASVNACLDGKKAEEARDAGSDLRLRCAEHAEASLRVLEGVVECLVEADESRIYHGGVSGLLSQPEFSDSKRMRPLLALLEDGFSMLQVLSEAMQAKDVIVRIGRENTVSDLGDMSMVAVNYGGSSAEGIVGLIGPTRMDYSRAIAAVRVVAEGLSDALKA